MSPKLLNIVLVLIPTVLYFGLINPLYTGEQGLIWTPEQSIDTLKAQNVQYANTLAQISLVEDGAKNLNKDYTSIDQATIDKVTTLLPDKVDPIELRNDVVTIASKSGIALTGFTVEPDIKLQSKQLGAYVVMFSIKAKYPAFKKFMEGFEKSMRFFVLESMTIKHPDTKDKDIDKSLSLIDSPEILAITLTFKVYYLK